MAESKGAKDGLTAAGKRRLKEMKNEPAPRKGWANTPLVDDEPKKGAKGRTTADVTLKYR